MSKVDSPNPPATTATTNKEYLYSTVHLLQSWTESGSPAHTYTECLLLLFSCFCACYCCSLSPRRLLYSGKRLYIRELEQRCLATSEPVYGPHIVMGMSAFKTFLKVKKRNSANSCGMGNLKKNNNNNKISVFKFVFAHSSLCPFLCQPVYLPVRMFFCRSYVCPVRVLQASTGVGSLV